MSGGGGTGVCGGGYLHINMTRGQGEVCVGFADHAWNRAHAATVAHDEVIPLDTANTLGRVTPRYARAPLQFLARVSVRTGLLNVLQSKNAV